METEMANSAVERQSSKDAGRITDEDIERNRAQIGISQYQHDPPYNRSVCEEVISHFAFGMVADENPLWHNPDHGKASRWRGLIAPPLFVTTTGLNETPKPEDPATKALFKGLYRGVGRYNVGTNWKLYQPIRPGDVIYVDSAAHKVEVKQQSSFSGGRTVIDSVRHLYVDKDGLPVALRLENFVNAERSGSKKAGKHDDFKRHVYTPEEIAEIDAHYAREEIRGAVPRWWEDVEIGDKIVPVVKGPLGTMDIIAAHLGWGLGSTYGGGPFRYNWKTRQTLKNFYSLDEYGVPQSMMRLHWDQGRAEELGLPAPYDYGQMRSNWLAHAITNWMGDDAWIADIDTAIKGFNFHGDTTVITGDVVDKRIDDEGNCTVRLAISGDNQRGQRTCSANAMVRLPSREHGPVVLPTAERQWLTKGARMMDDAATRAR